jgi:hypothetical protein
MNFPCVSCGIIRAALVEPVSGPSYLRPPHLRVQEVKAGLCDPDDLEDDVLLAQLLRRKTGAWRQLAHAEREISASLHLCWRGGWAGLVG